MCSQREPPPHIVHHRQPEVRAEQAMKVIFGKGGLGSDIGQRDIRVHHALDMRDATRQARSCPVGLGHFHGA